MNNETKNQKIKIKDVEIIDFNAEVNEMDEVAEEHKAILGKEDKNEKKLRAEEDIFILKIRECINKNEEMTVDEFFSKYSKNKPISRLN